MGLRLLAVACLVGAAFAGPLQRSTATQSCATKCPTPIHQKFNFEIGKKYVYEYYGENLITTAGSKKQKATIEGLAEFHILTRCEGILKLKNVKIEQKLSSREIEELVQKLEIPLSYAWDDGKVEYICPSSEESVQSLNIKKGVVSSMINTMSKLDKPEEIKEYDSLGYCNTKYTVNSARPLTIQKEKSLKSCTNRHSSLTSLITSPFDSPNSTVHTLPIFPQEKLLCKQVIEGQIIEKVECQEYAKIQPMKHRDSVIQFEGSIQLSLLTKELVDETRIAGRGMQESLLYTLEEPVADESREREAEVLLREMCTKTDGVVDVAVSKDFIQLVSIVRTLSDRSLEKIHRQLKDGSICDSKKVRDLFVDTLPMAGSSSAVKLMVQLLENKEIAGFKSKLWPASLALIPHPNKETIAAVLPLLKMDSSAPVLLGVSAMIHRFCSKENCDIIQPVQKIITILNEQLGRSCSSESEEKIFAALKALGNMGYLGEAQQNIIACAQDKSKPTRLRIAAIDAFRRSLQKRPQELLDIYCNVEENFELRIAAFSSVMKQADEEQLLRVKETAEKETERQVSAYTSTFIRNMKKTSSQLKKGVKELLKKIEVAVPSANYWENSKNIELSAFNEFLNVGASVEADIIHSSETKIPRSIYSRLDADLFDRNINFFEVGLRAEGLEELFKKLIGLKDKVPKEKSWSIFNPKNLLSETEADMSLFIRTMNTEIFDVAASDLTAIGEMIQIADIMNKLAHEKSSDFTHSFLFLNSKLIIPSVTGRAYSIDLTGSATVGLTARSKLNVLSFPRNADVHLHFQPSLNVEVSTTVGILSNQRRPDIKLVSRMHLESSMQAKFQIKDEHIALASLTLPSENIAFAKVSTDVLEIDDQQHERQVFEKRQNKIDYCFDTLHNIIGVSFCGKVEVTKPFVTKAFPFVQPVGSIELAIKKTDKSFDSYELEVEIPRHASQIMRYRASLDTPKSVVPRRFEADLKIKQQQRGQNEISLELISPFKRIGGSGSCMKSDNLIKGNLMLYSGSSHFLSANLSTEITESHSRKFYRPVIQVAYKQQTPTKVEGTISVIKGRKQQISIDLNANKPSSSPITLKGTIMKEGSIELSRQADWKLSSDLSVQSPMLKAHVRSALEKRSKQSHTIVTSLSVDYQRKGQREHSIKFTGSSQRNAGKLSTSAQFENSQLQVANWELKWDMQGDSLKNVKNDLTLKYGRNSEINIRHKTRIPESGQGECMIAILAPQLRIDSELAVTHEIDMGELPKVSIEADLRYEADKHVKSLIQMIRESKSPLKSSSRIEVQYPSGRWAYWDEVKEINHNTFEGKSTLQWSEDKKVEVKYRYSNLSTEASLHHQLETSLRLPSSQIPIRSKIQLAKSESELSVEGQLISPKRSEYILQAHLRKKGVSTLTLKAPKVEGNLKVSNEEIKKSFDIDLKTKINRPRRVSARALVEIRDSSKKFETEIMWDADQRPSQKFLATTTLDLNRLNSRTTYASRSELQITDLLAVSLSEAGETSFFGSHKTDVKVSGKKVEPFSLEVVQEGTESNAKTTIKFSRNNIQKVLIEMEGSLQRDRRNGKELSIKAAVKSLDNRFENVQLSVNIKKSVSESSSTIMSQITCLQGSSKMYKAEWNSDFQSGGLELNALLQTPHKNFEKQAVGVIYKRSSNDLSGVLSFELSQDRVVSLTYVLKKKSNGITASWLLKSPFRKIRDGKIVFDLKKQENKKSILSYMDLNSARVVDIQFSAMSSPAERQIEADFKIAKVPKFQGIAFSMIHKSNMLRLSTVTELEGNRQIKVLTNIQKETDAISATVRLTTPYSKLRSANVHLSLDNKKTKRSMVLTVDSNEQRKIDCEMRISSSSDSAEIIGRVKTGKRPELHAQIKAERNNGFISSSAKIVKRFASVNIDSRNQFNPTNSEAPETVLLDIKATKVLSKSKITYNLKAAGQFSPLSISLSSSHADKSSLNVEIAACRQTDKSVCYHVRSYHKKLLNAESYRNYRKISLDLEKTIDSTRTEALGSALILLSMSTHDVRSKVLFQHQDKSIGYEMRVHHRDNDNDHCSLETQIFLPEVTRRARASILQNHARTLLEMEIIPDASEPTRRLSFEVKRESSQEGVSAFIKVSSPRMAKPIVLSGKIQKGPRGKVELQYSPTSNKVLTLEIETESRRTQNNIVYRLYREDKSFDAVLTLMKKNSREEDMYSYEWSLKSAASELRKEGGMVIKLAKRSGKLQKMDILYSSPYVKVMVEGSKSHGPSQMKINIQSKGQSVQEIRILTTDSCIELDVLRSGPYFRSTACVNKQRDETVTLLSLDADFQREKCLDVEVSLDQENPALIDVTAKWDKAKLGKALMEVSGVNALLRDQSLKVIKEELQEKILELKRNVIRPEWRKVTKEVKVLKEKFVKKVSELLKVHSQMLKQKVKLATQVRENIIDYLKSVLPWDYVREEVMKPLRQAIMCFADKYFQAIMKNVPEFSKFIWQVAKNQFEDCLKKFCVEGTFCHDLFRTYQRYGLRRTKILIQKKISQTKRSLQQMRWIPEALSVVQERISEFLGWYRDEVQRFIHSIWNIEGFEDVKQHFRVFERQIRKNVSCYIKKLAEYFDRIFSVLERDEDYRIAKSLVQEAQRKVMSVWRRRERVAKDTCYSLKEMAVEKLLKNKLDIQQFDTKRGQVSLRIRNPFGPAQIQVFRNEMRSIKKRLLDYVPL